MIDEVVALLVARGAREEAHRVAGLELPARVGEKPERAKLPGAHACTPGDVSTLVTLAAPARAHATLSAPVYENRFSTRLPAREAREAAAVLAHVGEQADVEAAERMDLVRHAVLA